MTIRTSAALTALAATALAISGCQGSSAHSGGTSTTGASKPLIAVAGIVADSLDPDPKSIASSQLNYQESMNYMGKLFEFSGKGKSDSDPITMKDVVPELAQSITSSDNGLKYDVTLKQGVKSYAGNTLSSADVEWTLKRAVANKGFANLLLTIANVDTANPITVTGPLTFTINMSKPSEILEGVFAQGTLGIIDSVEAKKHATASDPWAHGWMTNHTASFGAYQVTSFDPSNQVTMEAFKNYVEGAPRIPKVVWKLVADSTARAQLVQGGSANFAYQGSLTDYAKLAHSSQVNARLIDVPAETVLLLNQTRAPFNKADVRRALLLALDRQSIASAILPGAGKQNNSCVPDGLTDSSFPQFPTSQDIAGAKKLLAGAGYPQGFKFTLTLSGASSSGDLPNMARFIQTQLQKVGVTMAIDTIPTQPQYLEKLNNGSSDAFLSYQSPFIPDAAYYMNGFVFSKSPFFPQAFLNSVSDQNILTAMSTQGAEHQTAVLNACKEIIDQTTAVPIMQEPLVYIMGKGVSGVKDYPTTIPVFKDMFVS